MFGFKKKETSFYAPQTGRIIEVTRVPDQVFAEKMLGDGYAVEPTDNRVYSPVEGVVTMIQDTGHAYGIRTSDGLEVLVHIGVNTVTLKGEGFESAVKEGTKVKPGTLLATVNLELLKEKNLPACTIVLITNMEDIRSIQVNTGEAIAAETIAMTYEK